MKTSKKMTWKMKSFFMLAFLFALSFTAYAQQNVGIGTKTPHPSAALEVFSKDSTKGLLIPRVNLLNDGDVTKVQNPATGLLVFNENALMMNGNGTGFYYWDGTKWLNLKGGSTVTFNDEIVKVITEKVTIIKELGDSVFQAIENRADSLIGDQFILVTGGDSSVLSKVNLKMDVVKLANDSAFAATLVNNNIFIDSLVKHDRFIDSLTQNEVFIDSLTNNTYFINDVVNNNTFRDSIINMVAGGNTTINNNIVNTIIDSVTTNIQLGDSIFQAVQNRADSLVGDKFIIVTGGDSSVLSKVNMNLDTKELGNDNTLINTIVKNETFIDSLTQNEVFIDSLTNNTYFINDVVNNNTFRDSIINMVAGGDTTINNNIVNTIIDSVTTNIQLGDSIFQAVQNRADSLVGDQFIGVTGGDSSVLSRVDLKLDTKKLGNDTTMLNSIINNEYFIDSLTQNEVFIDSLTNNTYFINDVVNNNTFRDSIINMVSGDTTINNSVVNTIIDSATTNIQLGDSIFQAVQNRGEAVKSKELIQLYNTTGDTVSSVDSTVLKGFQIGVNMEALRDSIVQVIKDSLSQITIVKPDVKNIRIITDSDGTVSDSDYTIIMKMAATDNKVLTIPAAADSKGRILVVKQTNSSKTMTFSQPIVYDDGTTSNEFLYPMTVSGSSITITIQSDGTNWQMIDRSL